MTQREPPIAHEIREGPSNRRGSCLCRPLPVAVLVFLLAAALAVGLIWRQEQYRQSEGRARAASLAGERAHNIQTSVDRVLTAT